MKVVSLIEELQELAGKDPDGSASIIVNVWCQGAIERRYFVSYSVDSGMAIIRQNAWRGGRNAKD